MLMISKTIKAVKFVLYLLEDFYLSFSYMKIYVLSFISLQVGGSD